MKNYNKIFEDFFDDLEVPEDNITNQIDINAPGKYDVIYTVIDSNNKDDYTLLVEQYVYMKGYLRILDKRIADVVSNIKCLKFNNNKK